MGLFGSRPHTSDSQAAAHFSPLNSLNPASLSGRRRSSSSSIFSPSPLNSAFGSLVPPSAGWLVHQEQDETSRESLPDQLTSAAEIVARLRLVEQLQHRLQLVSTEEQPPEENQGELSFLLLSLLYNALHCFFYRGFFFYSSFISREQLLSRVIIAGFF